MGEDELREMIKQIVQTELASMYSDIGYFLNKVGSQIVDKTLAAFEQNKKES